MKIINPTDKKLEMQFEGTTYSVEAEDSTEVSNKVATHWKKNVHSFIVIETEEVKVASEPVKEEKPKEDKKVEEVKEEKPKVSLNKTNKK